MAERDDEIERRETAMRMLLSLLYLLIGRAIETVLFLVILFELIYTLATKEPPGERVRNFANRVLSYFYRIGRFLTYNEHQAPFPFADFPAEVEPIGRGHRLPQEIRSVDDDEEEELEED